MKPPSCTRVVIVAFKAMVDHPMKTITLLDSEGLAGEPWEGSGGTAGAVGVGATRGERKGGRGEGWRGVRQHGCKLQLK